MWMTSEEKMQGRPQPYVNDRKAGNCQNNGKRQLHKASWFGDFVEEENRCFEWWFKSLDYLVKVTHPNSW